MPVYAIFYRGGGGGGGGEGGPCVSKKALNSVSFIKGSTVAEGGIPTGHLVLQRVAI